MKLRLPKVILIYVCIAALVSGCSVLDEINNSLNYVDTTTTYISDAAVFADKIQTMGMQVTTDLETVKSLKTELGSMKEKIINFNGIEAPALAKEIHNQLVNYNEILLNEINGYLDKLNSNINVEAIKDTQIFQTVEKIIQIQQQIEKISL